MGGYEPVKGDRVRVVMEGEVTSASSPGSSFVIGEEGERNFIIHDAEHVVSIERVEPPVVTFKPGDVVRAKTTGSLWVLATNGYNRMVNDRFTNAVEFFAWNPSVGDESFTSEDYELVTLP